MCFGGNFSSAQKILGREKNLSRKETKINQKPILKKIINPEGDWTKEKKFLTLLIIPVKFF